MTHPQLPCNGFLLGTPGFPFPTDRLPCTPGASFEHSYSSPRPAAYLDNRGPNFQAPRLMEQLPLRPGNVMVNMHLVHTVLEMWLSGLLPLQNKVEN